MFLAARNLVRQQPSRQRRSTESIDDSAVFVAHESVHGTFRTCSDVRSMVAIRAKRTLSALILKWCRAGAR